MSCLPRCKGRFAALAALGIIAASAVPAAAQNRSVVAQNDAAGPGGGGREAGRAADAPEAGLDRAMSDLQAAHRALAGAAEGRDVAETGEARLRAREALAVIENELQGLPRAQASEDRRARDLVMMEISQAREALSNAASEPAAAAQALRTVEQSVAHVRRQRDFGQPRAGEGRADAIELPAAGRGTAGGGTSASGPPAGDNPGSDAIISRRLEDTIPAERVPDSDRVHFPVLDENNSQTYLDEAHGSQLLGTTLHARKGEVLGNIDDFVIENGRLTAVLVDVGGFLGIGANRVAIPARRLYVSDGFVSVDMTRAEVEGLPSHGN